MIAMKSHPAGWLFLYGPPLFLTAALPRCLFVKRFQLLHGKRIIPAAEMAVDLNALPFPDHLLQLLPADTHKGFFHPRFIAVTAKHQRRAA